MTCMNMPPWMQIVRFNRPKGNRSARLSAAMRMVSGCGCWPVAEHGLQGRQRLVVSPSHLLRDPWMWDNDGFWSSRWCVAVFTWRCRRTLDQTDNRSIMNSKANYLITNILTSLSFSLTVEGPPNWSWQVVYFLLCRHRGRQASRGANTMYVTMSPAFTHCIDCHWQTLMKVTLCSSPYSDWGCEGSSRTICCRWRRWRSRQQKAQEGKRSVMCNTPSCIIHAHPHYSVTWENALKTFLIDPPHCVYRPIAWDW